MSLTVNQVLTIVAVTPPTIAAPPPAAGGVTPQGGGASAAGTVTGSAPIGSIAANTPSAFAVRDGGGQTLSVAVPETLALVQVGGDEQLTLTTTTGMVTGSGMDLLGGPLGAEGSLSFSIADRAVLFQDTSLGEYSGLLVLTAQYN